MPGRDELGGRGGAARGGDRGDERAPRHGRVGIDPLDAAFPLRAVRELAHERHVTGGVRLDEVLGLDRLGVHLEDHVPPKVGIRVDRIQDRAQACWRFGVILPRVVREARRMFHEDERDGHG